MSDGSGQVRLVVSLEKAQAHAFFDALEPVLEDDGFAASIFETFEDSGVFEVSVYVPDTQDQPELVSTSMRATLAALELGATVAQEAVPDEDWVTKSLEGLPPVRVGRFVIHGSHDRDAVRSGDVGIEIEAGQAFGTGHHGTTAGCLEMMSRVFERREPSRVLDLGTGSAVLAIAAAKAWKLPILATDIDPIAIQVARENARFNGVHGMVLCETAPGFHHAAIRREAPFDVIIANILAKPLMKMAPQVARHVMRDGDVILSGILSEQRQRVLAAFRQSGLYHVKTLWREGWVTLHLRATSQC